MRYYHLCRDCSMLLYAKKAAELLRLVHCGHHITARYILSKRTQAVVANTVTPLRADVLQDKSGAAMCWMTGTGELLLRSRFYIAGVAYLGTQSVLRRRGPGLIEKPSPSPRCFSFIATLIRLP